MFKKNKSGKKIKDCLLGFKKNQKGEVLNTRNKEEYMYKVLNHQYCKLFVYNIFFFFYFFLQKSMHINRTTAYFK